MYSFTNSELLKCLEKLSVNLADALRDSVSSATAHHHSVEKAEVAHGFRQIQQVIASVHERVQPLQNLNTFEQYNRVRTRK